MMTEQMYINRIFNEHFSSFNQTNIALYGLGSHTEMILEQFPEYKIVALLDGFKEDGLVYGKPIISLDKLILMEVNVIIIVARAASVKIIFKRISEFCKQHGIRVYDLIGNELTNEEKNIEKSSYEYTLSENDVKYKIEKYENISFDIFNTLLLRKVYHPYDVFELVQRKCQYNKIDFPRERSMAEQELAQFNPTIDEIYKKLISNTGITETDATMLMEIEIGIEKDVLVGRKNMIQLFDYAVSLGKKVSLISDMYLPLNILSEILMKNKIDRYNNIYISCEYHTHKRQNLYLLYKEQVKGSSYLHIGDDKDADGISAKLNGISELIVDSHIEMLENSTYRELITQMDTLEKRVSIGLVAEKLFNNPFCLVHTSGLPTIKSAYQLGYVFIAPILTNYVIWLRNQLKGQDYNKILFLSRDGYLIKQLYDAANAVIENENLFPQSIYFLSSRQAGISATAKTHADIIYASNLAFDGTPEELLKKRFLLNEDEIESYSEEKYSTIADYIIQHKDYIITHADELNENYKRYIDHLDIEQNDKIAFFDFVSTGTCQMCIEDILQHKLEGYYFLRLPERYEKKEKLSVVSYYDNESIYDNKSNLVENYFFVESIIKACEPSIAYFDSTGKPVYTRDNRSKEHLELIQEVHVGIMDFFRAYLKILKHSEIKAEKSLADQILGLLKNEYSDIKIAQLTECMIRDEFCNRDIRIDALD